MDHQVLGRAGDPPRVRVLVAALPESIFRKHVRMLTQAGLDAHFVEPATLALANETAARADRTGGVLLDIGHQASNLIVLLEDGRFFARRIEPGGQVFTGAIMHHFGMAEASAQELKHAVGLGPATGDVSAEARQVPALLSPVADQLVFELRRSLTFAETLPGFPHGFATLTLSGGGALLAGLPPLLARTLGVEIQILDPSPGLPIGVRGDDSPPTVFTHAVGLLERWL